MVREIPRITRECLPSDAILLMPDYAVPCLPVTEGQTLVGTLSRLDLLQLSNRGEWE